MSVFSSCSWSMTAAQLVTPTNTQLALLNSIQAAFIASTYWEQETTGVSSLGYKYFIVRPKAALGSLYGDIRIFFCERSNYSSSRYIADGTTGFNTATSVMAYMCPDGGACTFTPANIETWPGDIYPNTNYREPGLKTVWANIPVGAGALWLYECDGAVWLTTRSSATSYNLFAFGNIHYVAAADFIDENAAGTQIGLVGSYVKKGLTGSMSGTSMFVNTGIQNSFWTKTSGVAVRVYRGAANFAIAGSAMSNPTYETYKSTASFIPVLAVYTAINLYGNIALRGLYFSGAFKTRTTIQTAGSTIGYTFYPDDTVSSYCLAFMNS